MKFSILRLLIMTAILAGWATAARLMHEFFPFPDDGFEGRVMEAFGSLLVLMFVGLTATGVYAAAGVIEKKILSWKKR